MATQRLSIATIAGEAADIIASRFVHWRHSPDTSAIDSFCDALRNQGHTLPVIYFCEWIDYWLMGDMVPGPDAIEGRQFQIACLTPEQAQAWSDSVGNQHQEQEWLATRLREAAKEWGVIADKRMIVVIREVLGPSASDEEVQISLNNVPEWLSAFRSASSASAV